MICSELKDFLPMFPPLLMTPHELLCQEEQLMLLKRTKVLVFYFAPFKSPSVPPWEKKKIWWRRCITYVVECRNPLTLHTALFPQTDMNASCSYFQKTTSWFCGSSTELRFIYLYAFLVEWWNRGNLGSHTRVCPRANFVVSSGVAPQHYLVAEGGTACVWLENERT